ncbi:MAG: indolepyruvate oxidoreductase subunit beta [Oscillospiraceae bacterium]|nr:indolepyruvate oxidoreductase subunit beta [Oscillospiraceae bacterium]
MDNKQMNILIAGVGGQGTVLCSRLIAAAAMEAGLFVRTAETIGMAQRGGSVVSHVRTYSEKCSSMIPQGEADILIAFEPAEAAANLKYLKPDGSLIFSPSPVYSSAPKNAAYDPSAVCNYLTNLRNKIYVIVFDPLSVASAIGNPKVMNTVMVGAALGKGLLPFSIEDTESAVRKIVKPTHVEINLAALRAGINAVI